MDIELNNHKIIELEEAYKAIKSKLSAYFRNPKDVMY